MKYRRENVSAADIPAIRSFMSNTQLGAEMPWNWLNDRLSFTFAVSCTMHETAEADWASRAAIYRNSRGEIVSVVLTEGENRGELFFMSGPDELPEELLREMFAFAQEHSASPTDDGRRVLRLRIDPRFPFRGALACELGFTRSASAEVLSRRELETPRHTGTSISSNDTRNDALPTDGPGAIPVGYRLIEFPDPHLKSICHSRSFGYPDDEAMRARNEKGFERLTTMPDYMPFLDLMLVDSTGAPASMMGFWYDPLLHMAMLEPAGTVPEHRHRGLGRTLVEVGADRLRRLGARSLWVGSDQPFYLGCGFMPVHRWNVYEKVW